MTLIWESKEEVGKRGWKIKMPIYLKVIMGEDMLDLFKLIHETLIMIKKTNNHLIGWLS